MDQSDLSSCEYAMSRLGWRGIPSYGTLELDDAHAENQILVVFQGRMNERYESLQRCDGIVIATTLAHDEGLSPDSSNTFIERTRIMVSV